MTKAEAKQVALQVEMARKRLKVSARTNENIIFVLTQGFGYWRLADQSVLADELRSRGFAVERNLFTGQGWTIEAPSC